MIFYLSGSPERFLELRRYRDDLVGLGHEVSSRWLRGPVSERRNVDDFNTADVVVSFTESRDWHVDYGFFGALLFGMKRAVVGPAHHPYYKALPEGSRRFADWEALVRALRDGVFDKAIPEAGEKE